MHFALYLVCLHDSQCLNSLSETYVKDEMFDSQK